MKTVTPTIKSIPNYLSIVARNHSRILNHRQLIHRKIEIGKLLGLIEGGTSNSNAVSKNIAILDLLQKNEISVSDVITHLYKSQKTNISLSRKIFDEYLEELNHSGHIELHLTDVCDHECFGCYYKDRGNSVLPFEYIKELIKLYQPRSVVLVGGGEPTLYKSGPFQFADAVLEIKRIMPAIQIGLITKGTCIPPGNWQPLVDWVRLSIDAATPETFFHSKKKNAFHCVIDNYFRYLQGPIPHVGLGYLYWSDNIHETYQLTQMIFGLATHRSPHMIPKINIQYRPMRPSVEIPEKVRKNQVSDDMICSIKEIQAAINGFEQMIAKDRNLGNFIQEHTNWHKIAEGNGIREGMPFSHCYYCIAFKLFRPTGEVYPCSVRVSDKEYLLGNFLEPKNDEHIKINLLSFLTFNRNRSFCDSEKCRVSWLNNIAEIGLPNQQPSKEAAKSFFF